MQQRPVVVVHLSRSKPDLIKKALMMRAFLCVNIRFQSSLIASSKSKIIVVTSWLKSRLLKTS